MSLLLVACQENELVSQQNLLFLFIFVLFIYLFIHLFIYLFIYFIIYLFLTGEEKVNPKLKCPSINQFKRKKLSTRKNNGTLI